MSNLRTLINQPTRVSEKEVEHNGEKFLFRGSPDANVLAETVLLSPDRVTLLAEHWSRTTGQSINPDIVKHVKTIHATLQPVEWNSQTKSWDTLEIPYDESEIAALACKEAALYLKMLTVAYDVLGLTAEQQKSGDLLGEVSAGNSETSIPTKSP